MRRLNGIGVSPGSVSGRAVILIQRAQVLRYRISEARVGDELAKLERAREKTREQLIDIRARVAGRRGPDLASLFDAQVLMLDDPMLVPRAAELVRDRQINADWAVQQVLTEFGALFDEVDDVYLRERKGDVADLLGRLQMNLRQGGMAPRDLLKQIDEASVLIADELTPSLAAQVDWTRVRGFATDAGSRTYHTAILARSLEVPAVVGLHDASRIIQPGQLVVIDGDANEVIVDPDEEVLARAARTADDRRPALIAGESQRRKPAQTADGTRIRIEANIELADELAAARYAGAEGIGLYRSEFLLTDDAGIPGEDEQYEIYRGLLEGMAPDPVTIRTFDVGEERLATVSPATLSGAWSEEEERAGGRSLRGLRLSLRRPDVFQVQLRALLRAARHGTLRIMFPFVSGVDELRAARQMVADAGAMLRRRGEEVPMVPLGAMIEVPAAAYTSDLLAREVEFLTIGTNDLIQYCLAVNRADETVSGFYEPLHPAILRMIQMVRRAAAARRIPVSLCGEMAADPALLPLLVGLGLTELSMTPGAIGMAKQVLGELRRDDLRVLARRILRLPTAEEVERELMAALGRFAVLGDRAPGTSFRAGRDA